MKTDNGGRAVRAARGVALAVLALAVLLALPTSAWAADPDLRESGTVAIEQYQIAFIGSGNLGGGTLTYQGKSYPFTVGGLGIGGFGASKINATGTVYNLDDLADFEGAYGQARTGLTVGEGSGTFWLQNTKGVYMKLDAKREGLALSLGADGVIIDFD